MIVPASTYRIQFNAEYTFKHLSGILDFLDELGITTIYASPLQLPTKGSTHGYDGIDPSRINEEIGTIDELAALAGQLKERNMNWIQDIVPNHLAFNTTNVWLLDVLERGTNSPYAGYFDIDWEHPFYQGKLMTPFLEGPLSDMLSDRKLRLTFREDGFFINYYEENYPVCPESLPFVLSGVTDEETTNVHTNISSLIYAKEVTTDQWKQMKAAFIAGLHTEPILTALTEKISQINDDPSLLSALLSMQHYVLCDFRDSHTQINYRRFFNVNGLICLRMEDEKVFEDYHRLIHEFYQKGYIHGLRIDHIDGLKDPTAYVERLRRLFGPDCYIIVEKILDQKEQLPAHFEIQGTSGYEFLSYINQVLTDNEGAEDLLGIYHHYVPKKEDYETIVYRNKFDNLQSYLNGEWDNLLRLLLSLNLIKDEEIRMVNLKNALGSFMAAFPVYRIYIPSFPLEENDRTLVNLAFEEALNRNPDLTYELKLLEALFHPAEETAETQNRLTFLQRLMQFTGPLAAKGIEDTTFYSYNPLISHNEVGDQPCMLGITNAVFHEKMQERQFKNPLSLNCTSTHDTKRGEDGRMRINLLSELTDEWKTLVEQWQHINEPHRIKLGDVKAPLVNHEYFLYQAILGGFPEDGVLTEQFVERTKSYFVKVLRESKQMSDHVAPNLPYEKACTDFISHLLNPEHKFLPAFKPFLEKVTAYANTYSLVQTAIKIAAPGIPDIYRGCELWDISYVDPDNRRPVDYDLRISIQEQIRHLQQEGTDALLSYLRENWKAGAEKFYVTRTMLRLRREYPALFTGGDYIPVNVDGGERNIIAFHRRLQQHWLLLVLPVNIVETENFTMTVNLPDEAPRYWKNLLTQKEFTGATLQVGDLLQQFPIAVLQGIR